MLFLCLALCSAAYNQAFRNFMHKIEIDMRVSKTGIFCCFNMNSNINIIYTVSLITVITNANDSCNVVSQWFDKIGTTN